MAEKEIIKDLDNIRPIDHGTIAKPHTPIYKMHRYFARRPYSVFSELIKHYSNLGSIILDPFCGGGVTVVEGLKLKRKVIGVDINPMATFITRMEVIDIDLEELQRAFEEIEAKVKDEILELYMTKCPKCEKETPAEWFEWSYIYDCPNCENEIQLSEVKKLRGAKFQCPQCKEFFKLAGAKRIGEIPIRLKVNCEKCSFKGEKKPDNYDLKKVKFTNKNFVKIVKERKLWYPEDKIFVGEKTKELLNKGFKYFSELFTVRNLLSLALLLRTIGSLKWINEIEELLIFTFSSTLRGTNRMCFKPEKWQGGSPSDWPGHDYWVPVFPLEWPVWDYFCRCYRKVLKGKKQSIEELNGFYKEAKTFKELENNKSCLLLTESSTKLPLPDTSIDVIITDPPYGGNVNYTELSDFWAIWIKDILGLKPDELINNTEEAIENKYQGKGQKEYRDLMYKIFKECYRVLKPNRWMVMTFHNRDFQTWNAIHLAAHDAGFILSEEDGMIYQPPIQQYTTTYNLRAGGAMQGDFILSFQKAEKPPEKKIIPYVEVEKRIQELAAEAVLHHQGASLSAIYNKIMPFLLNNNLLEKIQVRDLPPYLKDSFEEREGKWYLKENIGDPLRNHLSNYSKSHYKEDYRVLDFVPVEARLEYLIRRLLYKQSYATQDEILNEIYSNLINSNAAEYGEITRVLNRIAELVPEPKDKRKVWKLKEDIEREKQLDLIEEKISEIVKTSEESEHDLIIRRLVEFGAKEEYASHIGKTEQKKYLDFRKLSIPMASNIQYGMDKKGFEIVTQIDVLWLKGDAIVAAFEVERSTTIDSGINRFRNLFAVQPNTTIEAYIVVPNKRKKEAEKKLSSPANVKNGLTKKIGYILFDDLDIKGNIEKIDFSKIKRKVV